MIALAKPVVFPTYPARPVNGGPLPMARPKRGEWGYQAKVNEWRGLVHVPSLTVFNRHGKRMSIEGCFRAALESLDTEHEWLDCGMLERRVPVGRGSVLVLDIPLHRGTFAERLAEVSRIGMAWQPPDAPPGGTVLHFAGSGVVAADGAAAFWEALLEGNRRAGCELFEGVVAKRMDSRYPVQLRSAEEKFPFWVKHRWEW
jgi:hypothetical protein